MENIQLDPRVQKIQNVAKLAGVAIVAGLASVVIIAVGASVITAAVVGIVALGAVNFGIPVAARAIALWRQKALTKLAEVFSEETIRDDERQEGERIGVLEKSYTTSRSELEGAMEELHAQMDSASEDEQKMLQSQIDALQGVIENAEATLKQRKEDFAELQRVNKLYIAFHRSAAAMERSEQAERDPQQLQNLETSRAAIKTRMRAAVAGKTIEAMNTQLRQKPDLAKIARIGNSRPITIPSDIKETQHAIQNRR